MSQTFANIPGIEANPGKYGMINIQVQSATHPLLGGKHQVQPSQSIWDFMRAAYAIDKKAVIRMVPEGGCKVSKGKDEFTITPMKPTTKHTEEDTKAEEVFLNSFKDKELSSGIAHDHVLKYVNTKPDMKFE